MAAQYDNPDPETTARLELRALEKMLAALCKHTEQLTSETSLHGRRQSREAEMQREAFEERRAQAEQLLRNPAREPDEIRIARLERLVEAIDCSRSYFSRCLREAA